MHGLFLWKTKNGIEITNAFQKVLDKFVQKPKHMGVLQYINWVLVTTQWYRNIFNLKEKMHKYMTSILENVYIGKFYACYTHIP